MKHKVQCLLEPPGHPMDVIRDIRGMFLSLTGFCQIHVCKKYNYNKLFDNSCVYVYACDM